MRPSRTITIFAVTAAAGTALVLGPRIVSGDGVFGGDSPLLASVGAVPSVRPTVELSNPAAEYQLRNGMNGLVLELPGDDTAIESGVAVQQWHNLHSTDQRWRIESTGDGDYVTFTNVRSEKVLTVKDGSVTNGAALIQVERKPGDDTQEWGLEDAGDGQVWIVNRATGKAVDVPDDDTNRRDGTVIQQWRLQDYAKDQRWVLVPVAVP